MPIPVVLGIDSSTQSTKILAAHTETGDTITTTRAPHTGENTQNPADWWTALRTATIPSTTTTPARRTTPSASQPARPLAALARHPSHPR